MTGVLCTVCGTLVNLFLQQLLVLHHGAKTQNVQFLQDHP